MGDTLPDGSLLAVYRKDQSAVGTFPSSTSPPAPAAPTRSGTPWPACLPKKLAICICRTDGTIVSELQVSDFDEERYLTNPTWSPDGKYLFVQVLDRAQHHMKLNMYRASDGAFVRTILSEQNDAWVEPLDPLYFLKDSWNFLYRTDNRDGYRNLYLCDTLGVIAR